MVAATVLPKPAAVADDAVVAVNDAGECTLPHPVWVNIRPILESVAGWVTDDEIDQWMVALHKANEDSGIRLS